MMTLVVYAAIGSLVAVIISIPIGFLLGKLFERKPASWRAMRRRVRNQPSRVLAGDTWASATISYGTVRIVDVKQSDDIDRVIVPNTHLTESSGTIATVGG
jgi:hypothetical protein